jgi:hypothetical protein
MAGMPDTIEISALAHIHGGAPVTTCTAADPQGTRGQASMSSWSGRYCDGPQTTLNKSLAMAHKPVDMFNTAVQLDARGFEEAMSRRAPVACQPGDVANTP